MKGLSKENELVGNRSPRRQVGHLRLKREEIKEGIYVGYLNWLGGARAIHEVETCIRFIRRNEFRWPMVLDAGAQVQRTVNKKQWTRLSSGCNSWLNESFFTIEESLVT